MRDHTKLRAFALADEVALLTYEITSSFPENERFGLTAQMRRAAVSVPSNIVEGCSRESQPDFLRFLNMAYGSLCELHYQLTLAKRLHFIEQLNFTSAEKRIVEAEKVLNGLIRSIRSKHLEP